MADALALTQSLIASHTRHQRCRVPGPPTPRTPRTTRPTTAKARRDADAAAAEEAREAMRDLDAFEVRVARRVAPSLDPRESPRSSHTAVLRSPAVSAGCSGWRPFPPRPKTLAAAGDNCLWWLHSMEELRRHPLLRLLRAHGVTVDDIAAAALPHGRWFRGERRLVLSNARTELRRVLEAALPPGVPVDGRCLDDLYALLNGRRAGGLLDYGHMLAHLELCLPVIAAHNADRYVRLFTSGACSNVGPLEFVSGATFSAVLHAMAAAAVDDAPDAPPVPPAVARLREGYHHEVALYTARQAPGRQVALHEALALFPHGTNFVAALRCGAYAEAVAQHHAVAHEWNTAPGAARQRALALEAAR